MVTKRTKMALMVTLLALVLSVGIAVAQDAAGVITATYTLTDMTIADIVNAVLPDTVLNDRGLLLGGIGSDLWHGPGDAANEFWMVTDRGPNGQIEVEGSDRRTFPIPEFTPLILHVTVDSDAITVQETIPVVDSASAPVTGLSNLDGHDEQAWDYAAAVELPYNQNGLD